MMSVETEPTDQTMTALHLVLFRLPRARSADVEHLVLKLNSEPTRLRGSLILMNSQNLSNRFSCASK